MKKFNLVPFFCSAIKNVADSIANTKKRAVEYECAKTKLEILFKKIDLDVYESEKISEYEMNISSKRKADINSLLDGSDVAKEFDNNSLKSLFNKKTELEELLMSDSDFSSKEKAAKMINKINDYLISYSDHDVSSFENVVEDIVRKNRTNNDDRKLLLEYGG